MTCDEGRRGIVLVTVLWSIALLSALAMSASLTFREFAGVMAVSRDRVQADALLTAGLEIAAGVVGDTERSFAETEFGVDLSTGSVRMRLADEGGRIDIGKAPAAVLAALLRSVGAPAAAAEAAARQIVELRGDRADGIGRRSGDVVERRSRSELPFTDVRQLAVVPGMAPDWIAAVAPLVTVFGNETVNPLTAPAAVIAALPGVDQGRLEAFLAMRRTASPDADRLGNMLGPAQQYVSTKPQKVASVELAARLPDGYTTAARAVITLLPQDSQPYRVLLWQPMASFRFR
jgi:general secretion pathway protein K